MNPVESPRVLIVGGAAGVGFACAEAFAARGAELILADYDGIALTRAAERLGAVSRYCDAILGSSVELFAEEMDCLFPSIDVLINAAGAGYVRALAMTRMTRAMLPLLRRARGTRFIVNIASARTSAPVEGLFPYASSPEAFEKLSRMFNDQLKGSKIDLVTIPPNLVATAMRARRPGKYADQGNINDMAVAQKVLDHVGARRPLPEHRLINFEPKAARR